MTMKKILSTTKGKFLVVLLICIVLILVITGIIRQKSDIGRSSIGESQIETEANKESQTEPESFVQITDQNVSISIPKLGIVQPLLIRIENDSEAVYSESGDMFAEMYFEKSVVSGMEIDAKINEIFENESKGFFNGNKQSIHFPIGQKDLFYSTYKESMELHGEQYLKFYPIVCSVISTVERLDEKILSIREYYDWRNALQDRYCYGITIDLKTGELLPLNYFVKCDVQTFNQYIAERLSERVLEEHQNSRYSNILDPPNTDQIPEIINRLQFEDYEYYLQNEGICIIVNQHIEEHQGRPYIISIPEKDIKEWL